MARLDLILRLAAFSSILLGVIQCSLFDLDYVDGMRVIHVGKYLESNGREPFRELRDVVHDYLSTSRARQKRDVNHDRKTLATEYRFHGDNHTVAFLHWLGAKSKVIFVFTANYQTIKIVNSRSIYANSAYVWRSTDYGTKFHADDKTKFPHSNGTISGIRFCNGGNNRVIVFDRPNAWLYVSDDQGETYKALKLRSFQPQDIQCHIANSDMLLGYDGSSQSKVLYYSKNGGVNWKLLSTDVVKYFWVPSSLGSSNPMQVFMEIGVKNLNYKTSILKYADLAQSTPVVKEFDSQLGGFDKLSFDIQGKYMFAKKHFPTFQLYVSYNLGKFKKASFPTTLSSKTDYLVADASEGEVLLCARSGGFLDFFHLYISDSTGTLFSLSLRSLAAVKTRYWGQIKVLADIHRVRSLRGVYIANTFIGHPLPGIKPVFRTMITFDKGGTWHPIRVPVEARASCVLPKCSLNFHMALSQHYAQITGIVSSKSAVGLILAQGWLGTTLTKNTDVYMSADGGLTWRKVHDGLHDFVLLDHGGLVIAVPLRQNTRSIQYSCDEGKTWQVSTVDEGLFAYGLVTEPGEATRIASIFGKHINQTKFEWLSVKLDFSSVLKTPCQDSNYTFWTPVDERVKGNCSMGEKLVYKRRKADDCCYNGRDYDVYFNRTTCNCTLEDYMCDVGYKRDSVDEECYPTVDAVLIPDVCPEKTTYMKSSGYRRVPGDRCSGGQLEIDLKPVVTICPTIAPSDIQIVVERNTVAAAKPVYFELAQGKGSTKTTWYIWDFGDGNITTNVTGLENAKNFTHTFPRHGQYNVSVTAGNKFGMTYTKILMKVIDEILGVTIEPPHAVLVGRPAYFNLTLRSNHPLSWAAEHGYVHFVWNFEDDKKPNLTWDSHVQYTFPKKGKYRVLLQAINDISRAHNFTDVIVHDKLLTLRLYFNEALDSMNKGTLEWRQYFAHLVLNEIVRITGVDGARLEVAVVPGLPTYVDVSIIERDSNASKNMEEISELIRYQVGRKNLEIALPDEGKAVVALYAEVLAPDERRPTPDGDSNGDDNRLAIAIGVAAGVVVLFLAGVVFYVYRRYSWLYRRYHRLSMNGLNADADAPLGYSADGEGVRYTVPDNNLTEDSDDELIGDIRPAGPLQVMDDEPNGEEASNTTEVATA